jgi:hypothetical protein
MNRLLHSPDQAESTNSNNEDMRYTGEAFLKHVGNKAWRAERCDCIKKQPFARMSMYEVNKPQSVKARRKRGNKAKCERPTHVAIPHHARLPTFLAPIPLASDSPARANARYFYLNVPLNPYFSSPIPHHGYTELAHVTNPIAGNSCGKSLLSGKKKKTAAERAPEKSGRNGSWQPARQGAREEPQGAGRKGTIGSFHTPTFTWN